LCGIASELTHRQEAWVLADPRDVGALAQAIEAVLEPLTAVALGERAWAWSQERNWPSVCLAQEAVYREVLQSTQRAKDSSHG
jgi:glycosyltransferase involved in cell wall biosynthesis